MVLYHTIHSNTNIPPLSLFNLAALTMVEITYAQLLEIPLEDEDQRKAVTSLINVPYGITHIPDNAFQNTNVEYVYLPFSITSIGERSFFGCRALKAINLPHNLESIEEMAFHSCTSLSHLSLPPLLTFCAPYALAGCHLKSIKIADAALRNPDFNMIYGYYVTPFGDCHELNQIAEYHKTSVEAYFCESHLSKLEMDRVSLKVWVLISLMRINGMRITAGLEGKRFTIFEDYNRMERMRLEGEGRGGDGILASLKLAVLYSMKLVWRVDNNILYYLRSNEENEFLENSRRLEERRREFSGVLAEKKITAFELWRYILMFL